MKRLSAIALLIVSINSNSYAGECENIIALSKTISTEVEDQTSVEENAASFCSEYQQAKSNGSAMGASASYKFLSASFASSQVSHEEVASKYCSGANSSSRHNAAYKRYIENISRDAYGAYKQCLDMPKDIKFILDVAASLPNEFSLAVRYQPSVASATATIEFKPSTGVTCEWDSGSETKMTFITTGMANLTCKRADQTKKSYVKVIRSNGLEQISIPWGPYDKDGNPIDVLFAIKKQNSDLAAKVDLLAQGIKSAVMAFNSVSCPVGWRPYENAYGKFIRGIDMNDPNRRTLGSIQEDALQGHKHISEGAWFITQAAGKIERGGYIGQANFGSVGNPVTDGVNGTPKVANETRPKNVALLFCEKI